MGFFRTVYYFLNWEYEGTTEREQIEKQRQVKYLMIKELREIQQGIIEREKIEKQKQHKYLMMKELKKKKKEWLPKKTKKIKTTKSQTTMKLSDFIDSPFKI
jgi:hypothetical protein